MTEGIFLNGRILEGLGYTKAFKPIYPNHEGRSARSLAVACKYSELRSQQLQLDFPTSPHVYEGLLYLLYALIGEPRVFR